MSAAGKEAVACVLDCLGEDKDREGLLDTPKRVVKSWRELFAGYGQEAEDVLKAVFSEGACDEMVVLRDISYFSTCEHHMLAFSGKAHVGYIPSGRVVGVSKLARLVEMFARRLQIQERLTSQIADALEEILQPKGCMVVVEGQHLCMTARGVKQPNAVMVTSAVRGVFRDEFKARDEFLRLIGR